MIGIVCLYPPLPQFIPVFSPHQLINLSAPQIYENLKFWNVFSLSKGLDCSVEKGSVANYLIWLRVAIRGELSPWKYITFPTPLCWVGSHACGMLRDQGAWSEHGGWVAQFCASLNGDGINFTIILLHRNTTTRPSHWELHNQVLLMLH